jgi:hypothetical protein
LPAASAQTPAAENATNRDLNAERNRAAAIEAELGPASIDAPERRVMAPAPDGVQKTSPEATGAAIMEAEPAPMQAPSDRTKRARIQPKVQARPDKLIPGDRTKGLSVDEF